MSAPIRLGFTGQKELVERLQRYASEARKKMRVALVELGEEKLRITQERVPYKTGKLHNTGRISVRVGEKQITLKILYGDDTVNYAWWVHENLEAKHSGGRRAKYVESVVLETKFSEELAAKLGLAEPGGLGE